MKSIEFFNDRQESELVVLLDQLDMWAVKHTVYNEDQYNRFERIISNLIYELRISGFYCGLKSKGLIIPTGKQPTYDHVYSRKLISKHLMDRHIEVPLTAEKLKQLLPTLLVSIVLSKEDNNKLSKIVKRNKYTLEDLMKMKHYRTASISLEYRTSKNCIVELITDEMKKLIGLEFNVFF